MCFQESPATSYNREMIAEWCRIYMYGEQFRLLYKYN
jgi:hypothetical protein